MKSPNFCASIRMSKFKRTFTYNNTPMISISGVYPKVSLRRNPFAQRIIDGQIQAQVDGFYQYASGELYRQAIETYKNAQENNFPFHPYEAVLQYTTTYNRNCHLSLYYDQYTYTGGAHGSTVRASSTWSLQSGKRIPLSDFFHSSKDYRTLLIQQITRQAEERMQQNPGIYFENYRELIAQNFNEESYYLSSSGINIYYQQYDIAPYATGIVVFTLPYTMNHYPSCYRR